MQNKTAIYGGSFDPLHIGHKTIIQESFKQLDIDHLYIIPTYLNPFKEKYHFTPEQRLKILQEHYKDQKKISIVPYEVESARPIPSIETIKYMKDTYHITKPYFILGADNLAHLHTWHGFEELKNLVKFVIATRDDIPIPKHYKTIEVDCKVSSTELRNKLC